MKVLKHSLLLSAVVLFAVLSITSCSGGETDETFSESASPENTADATDAAHGGDSAAREPSADGVRDTGPADETQSADAADGGTQPEPTQDGGVDAQPDRNAADDPVPESGPEPAPEPRRDGGVTDGATRPPLPRDWCRKAPCRFDSHCGKGQICVAGKCGTTKDCPAGSSCQCNMDADCVAGHRCEKGVCEKIKCNGACNGPKCRDDCLCPPRTACAADGSCKKCSATCASDGDCSGGDLCQSFGNGCTQCVKKGGLSNGEVCRDNFECASGLCKFTAPSATFGVCTKTCNNDSDCKSPARCRDYGAAKLCNGSKCKICLQGSGCDSMWSCNTDADCKGLVTHCSCCNKWRCARTGRCILVWFR